MVGARCHAGAVTAPHTFHSELFIWDAATSSSWFFLCVPADVSDEIRWEAGEARGFGSVRVEATIGRTRWATSVFPSTAHAGCFVLPVKKAVRAAEGLDDGDSVEVSLSTLAD